MTFDLPYSISITFQPPVLVRRGFALDAERIDESVGRNPQISAHTRRNYSGRLLRLKRWLDENGRVLDDASLALYIDDMNGRGLAPASALGARSALRFFAEALGLRSPDGPLTRDAVQRLRRGARDRGRGRSDALSAGDAAAILDTAGRPREYADGRRESPARAARRAAVDAALVGVLFHGALRRSEAAALEWADVGEAEDGPGLVVRVARSKTNPYGDSADVRYVNGAFADAVRRLRAESGGGSGPGRLVFGGLTGASLSRRLARAAAAAGVRKRVTAHSGRIGLAVALTLRGASTHDVMHAGNWKSPAMVAHYSAAARAEKGAVARYMR